MGQKVLGVIFLLWVLAGALAAGNTACNGNGRVVDGQCACFHGYGGELCELEATVALEESAEDIDSGSDDFVQDDAATDLEEASEELPEPKGYTDLSEDKRAAPAVAPGDMELDEVFPGFVDASHDADKDGPVAAAAPTPAPAPAAGALRGGRRNGLNKPCPGDCGHHGNCVDGECQCQHGYGGASCDVSLLTQGAGASQAGAVEQAEKPAGCPKDCNGNGVCTDSRCFCKNGFSGDDCSIGVDCTKDLNNCNGHGTCEGGVCVCEPAFYGADCSQVHPLSGIVETGINTPDGHVEDAADALPTANEEENAPTKSSSGQGQTSLQAPPQGRAVADKKPSANVALEGSVKKAKKDEAAANGEEEKTTNAPAAPAKESKHDLEKNEKESKPDLEKKIHDGGLDAAEKRMPDAAPPADLKPDEEKAKDAALAKPSIDDQVKLVKSALITAPEGPNIKAYNPPWPEAPMVPGAGIPAPGAMPNGNKPQPVEDAEVPKADAPNPNAPQDASTQVAKSASASAGDVISSAVTSAGAAAAQASPAPAVDPSLSPLPATTPASAPAEVQDPDTGLAKEAEKDVSDLKAEISQEDAEAMKAINKEEAAKVQQLQPSPDAGAANAAKASSTTDAAEKAHAPAADKAAAPAAARAPAANKDTAAAPAAAKLGSDLKMESTTQIDDASVASPSVKPPATGAHAPKAAATTATPAAAAAAVAAGASASAAAPAAKAMSEEGHKNAQEPYEVEGSWVHRMTAKTADAIISFATENDSKKSRDDGKSKFYGFFLFQMSLMGFVILLSTLYMPVALGLPVIPWLKKTGGKVAHHKHVSKIVSKIPGKKHKGHHGDETVVATLE